MCPSGRYSKSENTGDSDFQHISAGISDVRPVFAVLDADGDGKIGIDDLRSFYADIPGEITNEDDIGTMISVADSDKSGFVEFEEFERVLGFSGDLKTTPENQVLKEAFSVMDKDGDGFVGFSPTLPPFETLANKPLCNSLPPISLSLSLKALLQLHRPLFFSQVLPIKNLSLSKFSQSTTLSSLSQVLPLKTSLSL